MKRIIAVALLASAVSLAARAESVSSLSGASLDELCRLAPDGFCLGYAVGFRDGIGWERHGAARTICVPSDVSGDRIRAVIQRALRTAPDGQKDNAGIMVVDALSLAWPCPK